MTVEERIEAFNEENKPFYIVDHEGGIFSLCFPIDFLPDEEYTQCQTPFDAYAESIGADIYSVSGLRRFGNGYNWQAAFQEAFKDDSNIGKILFDCESGGFFCNCSDLDVLEDLGRRFNLLRQDTESFVPIIAEGIRNAEIREVEQERLMKTVKGQLMRHPQAAFDILTPYGDIRITPDMSRKLLNGDMLIVKIGDTQYANHELLNQPITGQQTDLFDNNLIRMKTEEAPELEEDMAMTM